uniref:Plasmid stabilization system protein ParE n=1 Tax=Candidatus Kentrum eta TaxID=2126337 RepID=A0A450UYF8_9GAMM|nr:MAG: Plasmid stabilization system protein ParE [Candidatus Kentron sp. H]VFJ97570.1 MAG: Plasmid stabilization system protein ParE [Candidatus Kentron sp. H]VFK03006.1 MAG: Plasmid stabilization system protein ParE [Candidatus Kentron sp. H]
MRMHLRPEAEADIEEAARWYERQRDGLGDEFLDEASTTLAAISDNPSLYPVVHGNIRRALIHRFPFGMYYRVEEETIVVVAVMHGSRHPRRWQKRT